MNNKKYSITQEQLEQLEHFKRMFEHTANQIQDLCYQERDDVVYGFELGKLHTNLRMWFVDFMELENEIRKQEVTNGK